MSLFSKLFGGGKSAEVPPEDYAGYQVFPEPIREGGGFRIAARIEKQIDGETRVHRMIRADTLEGEAAAVEATLAKARALIDQQGDSIFD